MTYCVLNVQSQLEASQGQVEVYLRVRFRVGPLTPPLLPP